MRLGLPHVWGLERTGGNLQHCSLCGVARVAWIVRLVETGAGDDDRSMDGMEIARLGELSDIASRSLSLAETKQVLTPMQRETVNDPLLRRRLSPEGLSLLTSRDAVR